MVRGKYVFPRPGLRFRSRISLSFTLRSQSQSHPISHTHLPIHSLTCASTLSSDPTNETAPIQYGTSRHLRPPPFLLDTQKSKVPNCMMALRG